MTSTLNMFKNKNHLIFDIQHLSADEKRKEIEKYNPLHYIFGYVLESKPWLSYGEMYGYQD
jgi:hypothetical protein